MGFDRSTGQSGRLAHGTSQPQTGRQSNDLMSNDGREKKMLADLADFISTVEEEWDSDSFISGWESGFRAGLAYAAKIAQSQGRGWGIEHAEQIRKAL